MNLHERLQHIGNWISDLFAKIPSEIKQYAKEAHAITAAIQAGLQSDVVTAITALIPGTWDDVIRAEAIAVLIALNAALTKLEDGNVCGDNACKNAILAKMASKLISIQDGNELAENRYDLYGQLTYSEAK